MITIRPAGETKVVTYTAVAGSQPWLGSIVAFFVWSTTDCYVKISNGEDATSTNGTPLKANIPIVIDVPVKNTLTAVTVSAIRITSDGLLYAQPVTVC